VAHRGCDRTQISLFIINTLVGCCFGKAVPKAVLTCNKEIFDLAYALRVKPVPPVPDRFIAYVHATFMNKVFHISQRE